MGFFVAKKPETLNLKNTIIMKQNNQFEMSINKFVK